MLWSLSYSFFLKADFYEETVSEWIMDLSTSEHLHLKNLHVFDVCTNQLKTNNSTTVIYAREWILIVGDQQQDFHTPKQGKNLNLRKYDSKPLLKLSSTLSCCYQCCIFELRLNIARIRYTQSSFVLCARRKAYKLICTNPFSAKTNPCYAPYIYFSSINVSYYII